MREQTTRFIREPSFGGADAAASAHDEALGPDHSGIRRDGPHERDLELDSGLADAFVQGRLDGEPHAAVEQRGGEPAVHRAGRIEMHVIRSRRHHHAPARRLGDVVTQRLRHGVERQRTVGEPGHEGEAAHLLLAIGAHNAVRLGGGGGDRHRLPRSSPQLGHRRWRATRFLRNVRERRRGRDTRPSSTRRLRLRRLRSHLAWPKRPKSTSKNWAGAHVIRMI